MRPYSRCSTFVDCIVRNEGCPMYSKLIVCTLMAILMFVVMELIAEQLVKHKFTSWGDVMVVTNADDHIPFHAYETKPWVKFLSLGVGAITFAIVYRHLTVDRV